MARIDMSELTPAQDDVLFNPQFVALMKDSINKTKKGAKKALKRFKDAPSSTYSMPTGLNERIAFKEMAQQEAIKRLENDSWDSVVNSMIDDYGIKNMLSETDQEGRAFPVLVW